MMTFREKIQAIFENNPFGLRNPSGIETHCGFGNSTIQNALHANREPSIRITKKLLEGLMINPNWWATGEGPMYISGSDTDRWNLFNTQKQMIDNLQRNNDNLLNQVKEMRDHIKLLNEKLNTIQPNRKLLTPTIKH